MAATSAPRFVAPTSSHVVPRSHQFCCGPRRHDRWRRDVLPRRHASWCRPPRSKNAKHFSRGLHVKIFQKKPKSKKGGSQVSSLSHHPQQRDNSNLRNFIAFSYELLIFCIKLFSFQFFHLKSLKYLNN